MAWFPFFIQLEGARGLLVGGGRVACRKAEKLLPFGARLTVVAPEICAELAGMAGLTLCRRPFADSDLDPAPDFVIAAAGDRALNRRVAALCKARRIRLAGTEIDCTVTCTGEGETQMDISTDVY